MSDMDHALELVRSAARREASGALYGARMITTFMGYTAEQIAAMREALQPLIDIAEAYDRNELDDEARKTWGRENQHHSSADPADIELYSGRGGRRLLTLGHALKAREAVK